jgi:hypothetical protein
MISPSKTTFSLGNLKILRPKVLKNLTNLLKKFCEFPLTLLFCDSDVFFFIYRGR